VFIYKINPAALRKVLVYEYPSSEVPAQAKALKKIIFNTFLCSRTKIINKMGEHLKIIEYPAKRSRKLFRSKKLPLTSYNLIINTRLFSTNIVEIQKGNTVFSKYSLNP
jgi:hypothetical protein